VSIYPEPDEIVMQLSMRDVNLGFFKEIKNLILQLYSGTPMFYDNGFLRDSTGNRIVHLSKSKREDLKHWFEKGYSVAEARVSCIVAWKSEEEEEEYAVILPDLVLNKRV
jgi:ATP-dependent DNA helicase RecQ